MGKEQTTSTERITRPSADPTRDRILAAAADLFSDQSFDGATTREIAARAGVTRAQRASGRARRESGLWYRAAGSHVVRGEIEDVPAGLSAVLDQPAQHQERLGVRATTASLPARAARAEVQAEARKRYASVCVHELNRFLTGF